MIGALGNYDFVGEVKLFDTICEEHYNSVTVRDRVTIT